MTDKQFSQKERTRAHVFISGFVQGVFFRSCTQQRAAVLGANGWVRNCSDGRVEAVFEGSKDAVEGMVDWVHQGPSPAVVDKVEVQWQGYKGEFDGFKIKY